MLWLPKTVAALRMTFVIQIFVLVPSQMMICLHVSFVDRHIIGRPPFHIRVLCYQIRLTDYKLVHMTYNFVTEDLRYLPHKDLIWHRAIAICSQPRSKVLPATNLKMI